MNDIQKEQIISKTIISLEKLPQLHKQIRDIDFSLSKLYPVALVEDNTFFVFDLNESGEKYEFKLEYPSPMPLPKEVLASFILDFYQNKPSAIISDEAFSNLEGYIYIFHEFVHCFQWKNGEEETRPTLEVEKKYKAEKNYMWELNHPFPYDNPDFINITAELISYTEQEDYDGVLCCQRKMNKVLDKIDYEYMIWQEWKEGFARYIENRMRSRVGLKMNSNNLQPPFNRVSFYEIGSRYIDLLIKNNPRLKDNIKELYQIMLNA